MTPTTTAAEVPAVEVRGLVKRYGDVTAVDGLDLCVAQGEVYGFLGPNGAGKTTTMRVLLGLIRPDAGTVRLFGRDPFVDVVGALDGVAGFVESPRFYPYLSGRKNLEYFAMLDGGDAADRIDEALDLVELKARSSDRAGGFSFGMKQRLGIAAALIRNPKLLILDEPTTGLDPAGQRDMRGLVERLAARGLTVLLSSHHMGEVEDLCTRVAIVRSGRVVREAPIDDLVDLTGSTYAASTTDDTAAAAICREVEGVVDAHPLAEGGIAISCGSVDVATVTLALAAAGIGLRQLTPQSLSLEDLFFELTTSDANEVMP